MSDTTSYWKGLCDLETFRESPAGLCQNDLLRREVLNDDVVAGATKNASARSSFIRDGEEWKS